VNAADFVSRSRPYCGALFGPVLLGSCVLLSSVSLRAQVHNASQTSDEIECITPDGRSTAISRSGAAPGQAGESVAARDTLICNLQEGLTIFIIPFPEGALCDRFTFVNENDDACGEFEIAVSDAHLAANSPEWVGVQGIVPFAHKRLFNLSMLGINARYVKLSFRVENTPDVACVDDHLKLQLVGSLSIAAAETTSIAAGPAHP
jgi:hypothetical protein